MYPYNAKRTFVGLMLSLFEKLCYVLVVLSIGVFLVSVWVAVTKYHKGLVWEAFALIVSAILLFLGSVVLCSSVTGIIIQRARKRDPSLFDNDMKGMVLREGQNGEGGYESADWLSNNRLRQIMALGKQ